jgi:peptidoglycan/LPS O-acetylase OafA/YrhL
MVTLYRFNIGPDCDQFAGRVIFKLLKFGDLGVDLFFVLSGFLITGILFDAKGQDRYFRNFYARRSLRIFPLYYGFLLVTLVLLPWLFGPRGNLFPEAQKYQAWLWLYGANFLMGFREEWCLGSFTHFWSLSVEEHFYLAWPLVIYFCSRKQAMLASLAAIAFSVIGRIVWIDTVGGTVAVEMFTFFRLDGLALGGLLALAARGPRGIKGLIPWALLAGAICAAAMLGISRLQDRRLLGIPTVIIAEFFGALIVLAVASKSTTWWGRIWHSPFLRFFGKYSYAMYVFQLPLIALMAPILTPEELCSRCGSVLAGRLAYIAMMTTVTTGAAVFSWYLYEKHFLAFKHRFENPKKPASAKPASDRSLSAVPPNAVAAAR